MPSDRFHFRAKMPPPPSLSGLWSNLLLWWWGSPLNREQPIITFMPDHRSSSTPTTEKLHFLYFFLERRRKITHRWAGPMTQKIGGGGCNPTGIHYCGDATATLPRGLTLVYFSKEGASHLWICCVWKLAKDA